MKHSEFQSRRPKIDWILDLCSHYCFDCGIVVPPPNYRSGARGLLTILELIVDKEGNTEESEEVICQDCWIKRLRGKGFYTPRENP